MPVLALTDTVLNMAVAAVVGAVVSAGQVVVLLYSVLGLAQAEVVKILAIRTLEELGGRGVLIPKVAAVLQEQMKVALAAVVRPVVMVAVMEEEAAEVHTSVVFF